MCNSFPVVSCEPGPIVAEQNIGNPRPRLSKQTNKHNNGLASKGRVAVDKWIQSARAGPKDDLRASWTRNDSILIIEAATNDGYE